MWLKWFPWKWMIRQTARRHGFMDPIWFWSVFQRFSQPSQVAGPIELIREGAIFHARGLINSRAIPQNQDWIWPYWVQRQFNPDEPSFIPRAFSLTYINLTERNWTGVGVPTSEAIPIVDSAGLVTPHFDGWSMDGWLLDDEGRLTAPSRNYETLRQKLCYRHNLAVLTRFENVGGRLLTAARVQSEADGPVCRVLYRGRSRTGGWLIITIRPYNPEGISFIRTISLDDSGRLWKINEKDSVLFDRPMDRHSVSNYARGDVASFLNNPNNQNAATCEVGMATAAAFYRLEPGRQVDVQVTIPLRSKSPAPPTMAAAEAVDLWQAEMHNGARLEIPDPRFKFLFEAALRTLVLHTAGGQAYPGPFTYKRFWFRDASYILYALLCANLIKRARRVLDTYPDRQKATGYFQSQQGEWDSNGQVLWILHRYWKLSGERLPDVWIDPIRKGAAWIVHKRLKNAEGAPHAGLMPAGFSAEHFGPNDYYYWDDFWSIAGLLCTTEMLYIADGETRAGRYYREAQDLLKSVNASLETCRQRLGTEAMPVSPYRRLDSGMIGSLAAGYPLQVFRTDDPRLRASADFMCRHHLHKDGFFLDISHSGINAYLTLHLAQVLMQAGDKRCLSLLDAIARLASPTGQWPEAIHPITEGGCMGDGQHVWAAAEWVVMLRNCFVYEDIHAGGLVFGAGLARRWLDTGCRLSLGPAPTLWGPLEVSFQKEGEEVVFEYRARWFGEIPKMTVRLPGREPVTVPENRTKITVSFK